MPYQLRQDRAGPGVRWYDYLKSELPDVFFVQNTGVLSIRLAYR